MKKKRKIRVKKRTSKRKNAKRKKITRGMKRNRRTIRKKTVSKHVFEKKNKRIPKRPKTKKRIVKKRNTLKADPVQLEPLRFTMRNTNLHNKLIEPEPAKDIAADGIGPVLHLPTNPAGQMSIQANTLRRLDVPLVSMVIPTYNCPYIASAIESALAQSYQRIEIIVVNDGSTKHKEKIRPYYDRIRYIEKKNGGIASALNTGIKLSRGEFFAWMCSDDLIDPHKVTRQMSFMQTNGAEASHTAFYRMDEKNKIIDQFLIQAFTKKQLIELMMKGNVINGATVMLNKKVFDEIGIFNEKLRCVQDYDMWCRILMKYHIHYLDEPLYNYRMHGNMISKRLKNVLDKERALVNQAYKGIFRELMNQ